MVVSLFLDKRSNPDPPNYFLLELLDLIIEKNYFKSDGQFNYQVKGVAMGCAPEPAITNLFMSWLEEKYILNPNVNPFFHHMSNYAHFIDDLILIYKDLDTLQQFCDWLNNIHSSISFSCIFHRNVISYLNAVFFCNSCNKLAVRLHGKLIDRNSYLNYRSFHPHNLRANIPFSQFLRVKRKCTRTRILLLPLPILGINFWNVVTLGLL